MSPAEAGASGPGAGDESRLPSAEPPAASADQLALQRSSLLRSVTHDLRTPLAAIRAIVTDLQAGARYDPETQAELLQTVCDEVDRLDRRVGNLLSMSRLEAGALEPRREAIDLGELVRHRLGVLASLLRDADVVVDLEPDLPLAVGDFGQIEEVLTNLLANAVRHAPAGTPVEIRVRRVHSEGVDEASSVLMTVCDHGPGIPPEWRTKVLEPFQRGPGSRSTGLGLAICRGVIEAHGGQITIEETPGGGASVGFTLPARRWVDRGEVDGDPERVVHDQGVGGRRGARHPAGPPRRAGHAGP